MDNIILLACLSVLGIIIAIALFLAGGYLWWRHKRSQLQFIEPNDEDSSNYSLRLPQSSTQEIQDTSITHTKAPPQLQAPTQSLTAPLQNNINRKLNGFLNLKTPLIGRCRVSIATLANDFIKETKVVTTCVIHRNVIERTIGVLKNQFLCLLSARELHYSPEKVCQIINVAFALQNVCIYYRVDD